MIKVDYRETANLVRVFTVHAHVEPSLLSTPVPESPHSRLRVLPSYHRRCVLHGGAPTATMGSCRYRRAFLLRTSG